MATDNVWEETYEYLKAHGREIGEAYNAGDQLAKEIVEMYKLYYVAQDPVTQAIIIESIKEWRTKHAS